MLIHEDMLLYKNCKEHKPSIKQVRKLEEGSNETRISLYSHAGTHVDAPLHMLADGYSVENIPVHQMYGKCYLLDMTHIKDCIRLEDIKMYSFEKGTFVFLKTINSEDAAYNPQHIYLSAKAAKYLVEQQIQVIGIDSLSIERNNKNHDTHNILLGNNMLIVEGLLLKNVPAGEYMAVVAPIPIVGGDGSPARVLLIKG